MTPRLANRQLIKLSPEKGVESKGRTMMPALELLWLAKRYVLG